jgi:hypothetical protein
MILKMNVRFSKMIPFSFFALLILSCREVIIEEDYSDAGQACFRIKTSRATYFYQKEAGGFSSILDREGIDWIGFSPDHNENYPSSAATSYRGLPNLVFRSEDGGAGHPGFNKCTTERITRNQIRTVSNSGEWQWTWTFHPDHATLTVDRTDRSHPYWFLYEGTPGGRFQPDEQYWGTDQGGPNFSTPDYYTGDPVYDQWNWFYAGDSRVDRIFFLGHRNPDDLADTFSYLGNSKEGIHAPDGMTVFGFGRTQDAIPLMQKEGQTFIIGFIEKKIKTQQDHALVSEKIRDLMDQ